MGTIKAEFIPLNETSLGRAIKMAAGDSVDARALLTLVHDGVCIRIHLLVGWLVGLLGLSPFM